MSKLSNDVIISAYGFSRPGLKTGVQNYIFSSEIRRGFRETGGTAPSRIPSSTPGSVTHLCKLHQGRRMGAR